MVSNPHGAYFENSWVLHGKGDHAMSEPSFKYFTPHRIGPHRGVRTDRYKLIEYYAEGDYWELFDLQEDPNELRNIYDDPTNTDLVTELKAELKGLQEKNQDFG